MLHIITRLYRFENLDLLYQSLPKEPDIRWHICKSAYREPITSQILEDPRIIVHEAPCSDRDRTTKTNFVFERVKDGYFCLLDDDTTFHENMYKVYERCKKMSFVGVIFGQQFCREGNLRLQALPPRIDKTDTGQGLSHSSCLETIKWPKSSNNNRDFIFWKSVYDFFTPSKCLLIDEAISWYNKLYKPTLLLLYNGSEQHRNNLKIIAPNWNIVATTDTETAKANIVDAEVVMGNHNLSEALPFNTRLKWLQTSSVGVDKILELSKPYLENVAISNARGVYTEEMTEHTVAMLLMMHRELHKLRDQQNNCVWNRPSNIPTLNGKRAIILGYGNLGKSIGKKLAAFGIAVWGINTQHQHCDGVYWKDCLPYADFVILCLPATEQTKHILGKTELEKIPSSAILINVGRAGCFDQELVVDMVKNRRLKGAALDVFDIEPIDKHSPIWNTENVFISPHTARSKENNPPFKFEKFFEVNLYKYISSGKIYNAIDKNKGY